MARKSIFDKIKNWIGKRLTGLVENSKNKDNPLARTIKKVGFAFLEGTRNDFQESPFDFEEIDAAYNTDSYVRQALDKYIELMFKAGWKIKYKNDKVKEYMRKRLILLSEAMGEPIDQFWKDISEDLVKYSNVFLVKARQDPHPMKGITYKGLGGKKPVAGYFRLHPSTITIQVDEHGTVRKYKQEVDGNEKTFSPEDIVHIYYKKPAGKFFGVPLATPVLDDVRLLREIEDNVARLIYRHLNPLYLYKVGLDKPGYEATDEEIEAMKEQIQSMPTEGALVVSERHDVKVLGAERQALDVEKYLKYFERRIFTGFGTPETVMGRGDTSNRSTAETQSVEMRDSVEAYQTVMQDFINHFILRELLLEGGFDPVLNPEHVAEFEFNEIDIDMQIKLENHIIYKYEHNAISHDEMRMALGLDPVSDFSKFNGNMFRQDTDDTDNRVDPKNQYSNEFIKDHLKGNILESKILTTYMQARREIIDNLDFYFEGIKSKDLVTRELLYSLENAKRSIKYFTVSYASQAYKKGYEAGQKELLLEEGANNIPNPNKFLSEKVEEYLSEFSDILKIQLLQSLNNKEELKDVIAKQSSIFDTLEYKLLYLSNGFLMRAYNCGFADVGKHCGVKSIYFQSKGKVEEITLTDRIFEKLPAQPFVNNYYLSYTNKSIAKGGQLVEKKVC